MMENNISWKILVRRGDNHATLLIDTAGNAFRKHWGIDEDKSEFKIDYYRQLDGARWMSEKDLKDYVDLLKQKEINQPGVLVDYCKEYRRRINRTRDFVEKYKDKDFTKISKEELLKVFSNFYDITCRMWAFAYNYVMINEFLPDLILTELKTKINNPKKQNEYLNTLLELEDSSEAKKEKLDLLKLTEIVDKKGWGEFVQEKIKKHIKRYGYLKKYYYRGQIYTTKDIKLRIKDLLEKGLEKELKKWEENKKVLQKQKELIKELSLDKKTLLFLETGRSWASISNYVDEAYTYAGEFLKPMFFEIAKRLNLKYEHLLDMKGKEIIESLKLGKSVVDVKELDERLVECAIIFEKDKSIILSGKDLEEYKIQELKQENLSNINELKGTVACPGIGKGKVKIILRDADAKKIVKGDILVASMTNPTLVPAMEKSLAIITDEGGLLSHAAIVSRELNIPCIVGTKNATKVLQDGNEVEILENGIIKRIT